MLVFLATGGGNLKGHEYAAIFTERARRLLVKNGVLPDTFYKSVPDPARFAEEQEKARKAAEQAQPKTTPKSPEAAKPQPGPPKPQEAPKLKPEAAAPAKESPRDIFGEEAGRIKDAARRIEKAFIGAGEQGFSHGAVENESGSAGLIRKGRAIFTQRFRTLKMLAGKVALGEAEIGELAVLYNEMRLPGEAASMLYFKEVDDALATASKAMEIAMRTANPADVVKARGQSARAMEMLARRMEQMAQAERRSVQFETDAKNNAKALEKGRMRRTMDAFINIQLTPNNLLRKLDGFRKGHGGIGYFFSTWERKCNIRNKQELVLGNSFFTALQNMKGYNAFLRDKTMSGVKLGEAELTMQECISFVGLMRTLGDKRIDSLPGIAIERDGKMQIIEMKPEEFRAALPKALDALKEHSVQGQYLACMNKMFEHYRELLAETAEAVNGTKKAMRDKDKYFPVSYYSGDGSIGGYDIAQEAVSGFENISYMQGRNRKEGGYLRVAPAATVCENYIISASKYIAWAEFGKELEMMARHNSVNGGLLEITAMYLSEADAKTLKNYIEDVNDYRSQGRKDIISEALKKLRSNLAYAALTARVSSALKQPSSAWSAMGLIKPAAIVRARYTIGKARGAHINENNPILANRRYGNIDPTLSEALKEDGNIVKRVINRTPGLKILAKAMPLMDAYTSRELYAACWYDVKMDNPGMDTAAADFTEAVDAKFAEVMLSTQSDTTMISNAEYLRSENELLRTLGMFRGQPTMQFNRVITAVMEARAAKGTDGYEKAKQEAALTIAGQAGSALSYSLLGIAANALLHKLGRDDGDDDKLIEEFAKTALSNSVETFAGMVWFGDTASQWLMNTVFGDDAGKFYGINLSAIDTISDALDSISSVAKKPSINNIRYAVENISELFGVPAAGVHQLINAAAMWGIDIARLASGEDPAAYDDVIRYISKQAENKAEDQGYDNWLDAAVHEAVLSGDRREIARERERLYDETEASGLYIGKAPNAVSSGGESHKLSEKEKKAYDEASETVCTELLSGLLSSDIYESADDEERTAMVKEIVSYARDRGRKAALELTGRKYEGDYEKISGLVDAGEYLAVRAMYKVLDGTEDWTAMDSLIKRYGELNIKSRELMAESYARLDNMLEASRQGINSQEYNRAYRLYQFYSNANGNKTDNAEDLKTALFSLKGINEAQAEWLANDLRIWKSIPVDTESYDKLTAGGVSHENANAVMDAFRTLQPAEGYKTIQAAQKFHAISETPGLNDSEKWKAFFAIATEKDLDEGKKYWRWGYSYDRFVFYCNRCDIKTK